MTLDALGLVGPGGPAGGRAPAQELADLVHHKHGRGQQHNEYQVLRHEER